MCCGGSLARGHIGNSGDGYGYVCHGIQLGIDWLYWTWIRMWYGIDRRRTGGLIAVVWN
jgi:hypothetical protein